MIRFRTAIITLLVLISMLTVLVGCAGDPFYGDVWFDEITISSNTSLHTADGTPIGGGGVVAGGDVVGTPPSTDHAVARYDGVTGLLIQNSAVTIDNFGNIVTPNDIDGFDINASNDLSCTNDLDVTDDAGVGGDLTVGGDLDVTGLANIDEYLNIGASPPVVLPDGGAYFDSMARIRTEEYGGGIFVLEHDFAFPIHTGTGSFDLTGGAYENYFTATVAVFTQEDADLNNFIVIISGAHLGYAAEIEDYIDTTHVTLNTFRWDADLVGVPFAIIRHPSFAVGDAGQVGVHAQNDGSFHVLSDNYTDEALMGIKLDAAADDVQGISTVVLANGYSGIEALGIRYVSGNLSVGDHASIIKINMDETGAGVSDATTEIDFINILTTDENDLEKHAIHVGQSFDSALTVSGGTEENPDYGYEVSPDIATDRVNGIAPDGTAFLEVSAANLIIFDADNDYILIGSDATFEAIDAILVSGSNKNIIAEYYYSTGVGTWATLVVSESTNGFQQSGTITFNAPGAWALTNATVPAGAAITNAYYVKIVRTRNFIGAPPVEDYFKTYTASSLTDFEIRGDGTIRPVEMADASAPNNSLYYSTTQGKLVYKDNVGAVHDLW